MKRLFNLFLAVVMIFSFTCIQVYAANGTGGSGNIDGGGGSMGDATSHGSWNPGNEGVRVTVVRASDHAVVTTPFDLTNKTPSAGIYHFGKVSKIQYNNGTGLSPVQGGYSYKNPVQPMPRIISTNGRNNIEAIKKYFCSEYVVKFIAEETGMDYDTLISGEYKILLEPIAYYKFQGVMIATTATEAALYDEVVGGQLRYWMGSLTAKNLPLSMFLETPDLGYPILSDLYKLIEQEYREYDGNCHQLYTAELLQEILLGLHSMCQGAEAQFFNGHTNVTSSRFIVFGVKGLLQASKNVRGAMLFNILSYMSDRLLTIGNTTAALDELYVWLSDNVSVGTTIIEYIRNTLKRVRKKESNLIMASQNLEDFDREGIRELTKPLFAIPPHQFIFNCGSIDKRFYMDLLQLEEAEYNLIRFPQRGVCLFKCGNERYLLEVHAPAYKEALFGTAGGR